MSWFLSNSGFPLGRLVDMDTYTDVVSNTVCFEPAPLGPSPLTQPRALVCSPRPPDRPRPERQIVPLPHRTPSADHPPACAVCGGPGQQLERPLAMLRPDPSHATGAAAAHPGESSGATDEDGDPPYEPDHGLPPSAAAVPPSPTAISSCPSSNHEPGGYGDGIDGSSPAPQPRGGGGLPGEGDGGSSSGGEEAAGGGYHGVNPAWPTGVNPVSADAGLGAGDDDDGRALPFIVVGADGRAEVGEEAAALLGRLRGPVAVVAVVGPYRSGKSFLLNRVLLGRAGSGGFPVGGTVEACTKGLWMWSKALPAAGPDGSPVNVVLVDTEGAPPPRARASAWRPATKTVAAAVPLPLGGLAAHLPGAAGPHCHSPTAPTPAPPDPSPTGRARCCRQGWARWTRTATTTRGCSAWRCSSAPSSSTTGSSPPPYGLVPEPRPSSHPLRLLSLSRRRRERETGLHSERWEWAGAAGTVGDRGNGGGAGS